MEAFTTIFTHADGSHVIIALMRRFLSVCLSVCPHDKTKTAETKIAKLGTGIEHSPSRYLAHQWILGQRSKVKIMVRFRRSSGRRE